ncbi:hypothetical protein F9Z43_23915 [Pseudomonas monteilii]|uniref:Uncharacterized protein n=1 Tax=Pseudomonas monteilii TaxID=76759 RepID=A0A7X3F6C7_9PSED|nr:MULTISPECIES: hypothetical protein [Pseudomonas]MCA4076233.1 hypothetical protein [Pseudomonas kurunegalensis]MDT3748379.1 hypothetical protein [Pseudomonas kurunegalensis]MVF52293.1 hypothetical protein [Pseudomonas monteilii]
MNSSATRRDSFKTGAVSIARSTGLWSKKAFLALCLLVGTSYGSMIIALLSIGSAAMISVMSGDIKAEYTATQTWAQFFQTEYLWPSIILSIAAVIAVFLREVGVVTSTRKKEKELQDRLTTMPPKQFLAAYSDAVIDIRFLFESQEQDDSQPMSKQSLASDIRVVLTKILVLAQNWDSAPTETYRANIMMVELDKDVIRNKFSQQVNESPFFLFSSNIDARLDNADGILHITDLELSTSVGNQDLADPDNEIRPICFPFKINTSDHAKSHPNLPGGPVAVSTNESQYIQDSRTHFKEWLDDEARQNPHVTEHYKTTIGKYYNTHRYATSILSIPLAPGDDTKTPIGCLNIYNNKANILMGDSRNAQFVQLLQPICAYLHDMILLYRAFIDMEASEDE